MPSALINVPAKAKRGDVIEIKTLMSHIMETGYRHTASGEVMPRDIITSFTCRYNGNEIFRADLFPAIAANPFITFFTTATESGKFEFEWIGDNGFSETAVRLDHRRMRFACIIVMAGLLAADAARRGNPASRAPLRLQLHDAGHQGDAGRRHRQSRHAVGARRRERCGTARPAPQTRPAPIATTMRAPA